MSEPLDPHSPPSGRPATPGHPGPGQPAPAEHTQEIPHHDTTHELSVTPGHPAEGGPAAGGPPAGASTTPGSVLPPPQGAPYGSGGSTPAGPTARPARRGGWWQVPTAALAAALLASGGTAALVSHNADGRAGSAVTTHSPSPAAGSARNTQAPLQQANADAPNWKATAAAVSPSVVSISVADAGGNGGEGSGVILDQQGHIVTNNHVVGRNGSDPQIVVTLSDQRAFRAKIVGLDPSTDLAVIQLQDGVKDLRPIAIGDSDKIAVGAPVMAVGNPLGLSGTVTTGIVSALNRPVRTTQQPQQDPMGGLFGGRQQSAANEVITNAIQTSAPINPGNSGGALVNADGQLVGINSSIASMGTAEGEQGGSIGIGFAIPVNEVTSIADQLIKSGKAEHAFMGVTSTTDMVKDGDGQRVAAVIGTVVPGGPADQAGLRPKDAIIAIEGEPVTGSNSLVAQVRERKVGDKVTMTYLRDGARKDVEVTFAQKSQS
ncbi:S1C family serine protease [Arsenicicoccus dermatophilus]|uniref:S1C family serine protease n=1 Tax=Arsenicicoccus dermatophilus TaxID=1076331 RepID=UPI001F4CDDB8|nr:trypsin-like peptidase domain-containing protein [Arsenicicoccus dermatophilus]MCH8612054.1 trypsin-like peptidase domain-containing protein [Arsenicicoccus dermatophilus]